MPAGGIVGIIGGATTFDHCVNNGNITNNGSEVNNSSAGGIFGHTPSGSVIANYCINTGDILSTCCQAGGIGTSLYGNDEYNYCYNSGNITGNRDGKCAAGGITPTPLFGNTKRIEKCVNNGIVTVVNGTFTKIGTIGSTSYYYDNSFLKTQGEDDCDNAQSVHAILNGGSDTEFWTIADGFIIPVSLVINE